MDEILQSAKNGDENAISTLMEKYKPLVVSISRKYFLINSPLEDIIQEGMIGLFKALRGYKLDSKTDFESYASLCINRQIQNAIKSNNRNKNIPINTYLSISNQGKILLNVKPTNENTEDDDKGIYIPSNSLTPEESVLFKEKLVEVNNEINILLSSFEKKVLHLYIKGLNYNEIALLLNKEPKSIDNALSRIKIKLRDLKCI